MSSVSLGLCSCAKARVGCDCEPKIIGITQNDLKYMQTLELDDISKYRDKLKMINVFNNLIFDHLERCCDWDSLDHVKKLVEKIKELCKIE